MTKHIIDKTYSDVKYKIISFNDILNKLDNKEKISYKDLIIDYYGSHITIYEFMYKKTILKGGYKYSKVDLTTYSLKNKILAEGVVKFIFQNTHYKTATLLGMLSFVRRFVKFIHSNYKDITRLNFEEVFENYTEHLIIGYSNNDFVVKSAKDYQRTAYMFILAIENDSEIEFNAYKITGKNHTGANDINAMGEEQYNKAFYAYYKIFKESSSFILENKKFPYRFKLDKINREFAFVPQSQLCVARDDGYCRFEAYDLRIGTKTLEQIKKESNYQVKSPHEYALKNTIESGTRQKLDNWNKAVNEHNNGVLNVGYDCVAALAYQSFQILFLYITGMTESEMATARYSDTLLINKTIRKFKVVKKRANGKINEYIFHKKFQQDFFSFLKIRNYILKQKKSDYLFFKLHFDSIDSKEDMKLDISYISKNISSKFAIPELHIQTKKIRHFRSTRNIRKFGVIKAAQLNQNTLSTTLKHYTNEMQKDEEKDVANYFDKLNNVVLNSTNRNNQTSISVGNCASTDNKADYILKPEHIKLDCANEEGCLFCTHYRIHSDDKDIRKILSLKYIIKETEYIADSKKQHLAIWGIVLMRIKSILNYMGDKKEKKELIQRVTKEVFEEEKLDQYWMNKLEMLVEIGVL